MEELHSEDRDGVRTLVLDRPAVRNALSMELRRSLAKALADADADPEVRVIVVTGAGGHFCAGADLNELDRDRGPQDAFDHLTSVAQVVFSTLRSLRTPAIAKVEGVAAGAGMFLALGCDIVVAADDARFIASHLNVGLPPDWGGIWLLPRLVGLARAKAMVLPGRSVPAPQAAAWGLIAEAVPASELQATVDGYAAALAAAPPLALALARQGLDRSLDLSLDAFLQWEAAAVALALTTPEHRERVQAFLARRSRTGQ